MWTKHFLIFLSILYSLQVSGQKLATNEKDELIQHINQAAKNTSTLQADFTQEKYIDILSDKIQSRGKIVLKAPSKLKWHYDDPYPYTIILTGSEILIDDEGNKNEFNIESSQIFQQVNDMIINSVKGNLIDTNRFKATFFKADNGYRIELVPTDNQISEYFSKIILKIDNTQYRVTNIKLQEPSGDYTEIQFFNQKINDPVSDKEFTL